MFCKTSKKATLLLPNRSVTGMIRPRDERDERDEVDTRVLVARGCSGARGEWLQRNAAITRCGLFPLHPFCTHSFSFFLTCNNRTSVNRHATSKRLSWRRTSGDYSSVSRGDTNWYGLMV